MALGDTGFIYDNPDVTITDTQAVPVISDISIVVSQAMVMISHMEVPIPATAGRDYPLIEVSDKYTGTVTLTFFTDAYGAADLDGIFSDILKPPYGTGEGKAVVNIRPDEAAVGAANPELTLPIIVSSWEPFGSGQVGQLVSQTRTFNIAGSAVDKAIV